MDVASKKALRHYLGVVTSLRHESSKTVGWIVTNEVGFDWWNKRGKDLVELRFVSENVLLVHPGDGVVFEWSGKCAIHVARAICNKENIQLALSYAKLNQYIDGTVTGWREKCDRHVLSLVIGDGEIDQEKATLLVSSINEFLSRLPKRERRDVTYGWMMDRWFSPRMKECLICAGRQLDDLHVVRSAFRDFMPHENIDGHVQPKISDCHDSIHGQDNHESDLNNKECVMDDAVNVRRAKISPPTSVALAAREILHDFYLQTIRNRLSALDTPTDDDRKRWVWELVQNAKDSVANCLPRRTIRVEIDIVGDDVRFTHNGEPFTPHCRNGLLYQYSKDKRDQEGSTGRFGTGFMATHCLSRVVDIQADMRDEDGVHGFEITIHREGQNDEQQLDGLKRMEASDTFYDLPFGKTTFTYHVKSDSGRRSIDLGVEEIKKYACAVMLFCSDLEVISLKRDGVLFSAKRSCPKAIGNGISAVSFETIDGTTHCTRTFLCTSVIEHSDLLTEKYNRNRNIHVDTAIEYDSEKNVIIPHDRSVFCVFPVIGSEQQLQFPMLVNSPDFELTPERDVVRLMQGERTENGQPTPDAVNRDILNRIPALYERLIQTLIAQGSSRLYLLTDGLRDVIHHKMTDESWYCQNTLLQLRSVLSHSSVAMASRSGKQIALADAAIVRDDDNDKEKKLCSLLSRMDSAKVGNVLDENREWARRVWIGEGIKLWTGGRLSGYIADCKCLQNVPADDSEDIAIWYNDFLNCVGEDGYKNYALLPDMAGSFHSYDDAEFRQADQVGEDAFELIKRLGGNVESNVLSLKINGLVLPQKFNLQSCAAKINEAVRNITQRQEDDKYKVQLLMPLISVLKSSGDEMDVDFKDKRSNVLKCICAIFGEQEHNSFSDLVLSKNSWNDVDTWAIAVMAKRIAGFQSIAGLVDSGLSSTKAEAIALLNEYYSLLLMQKIQYSMLTIFPNQHGDFRTRAELWAQEGIIDDQIEDIAYALDERQGDFRTVLMDENCVVGVQPERKKKLSDVCAFVDTYIDEKSSDKRARSAEPFREAVRELLDDWRESHPELFTRANFPKIFDSYNDLEIEIVHTAEERRLTNEILRKFSVRDIEALLRDGQISPMVDADKVPATVQQGLPVIGVALSDDQYGGLSNEQKLDALHEAKRMVREKLEAENFVFEQGLCEKEFSLVNGVTKDGIEYPLVVHSYLDQKRQFQLSPADWEQLTKPRSMLWVRTQQGVGCVPFRELVLNREKIDLSFSTANLEIQDRIGALASVMRWFKGLHFDFGSLIQPKVGQAVLFDLPEQGVNGEQKAAELLPDPEEGVLG